MALIQNHYIVMKQRLSIVFWLLFVFTTFAQNYPSQSDVLWVTTPSHANWLYKLNEEAKITVSLYEYGILKSDVRIDYSIGPDMMPVTETGTLTLKNGKAEISLGTMARPGFKDCQLRVTLNGEEYKHHIKLGFAPEKLEPYTKLPADFISFWDAAKAEAAKCPMEIEKVFVPEYSSDKVDCYLIKLQVFKKGSYIYGYLTLPKKEGKYPVVFSPPGAGIKPMDPTKDISYAENGCVRFDMEIHGIRPNLDTETYKAISQAFGNGNNSYLVNGLDGRDSYYMKKVYLSFQRVVDYLTSLPQWDGKNIIAQGGSQGGALALIATGLDSRITACAANHPALSDMAGYKAGRAGGYPHLFTNFTGIDMPQKLKTLEYYDVVNFAKQIKVPVFMTWGYNDNVCPPTTSHIVYNVLNCKKEALITPVNEHWISLATRRGILAWIKKNLK